MSSWSDGMNSLVAEMQEARARRVEINEETLTIELMDGRVISVPLAWYPRLWYGNPEERAHFEIIGDGTIIHWPDLDEDLSVSGMLFGRRSAETPKSLKKWLEAHGKQRSASK